MKNTINIIKKIVPSKNKLFGFGVVCIDGQNAHIFLYFRLNNVVKINEGINELENAQKNIFPRSKFIMVNKKLKS